MLDDHSRRPYKQEKLLCEHFMSDYHTECQTIINSTCRQDVIHRCSEKQVNCNIKTQTEASKYPERQVENSEAAYSN